jgi:pimeloyl-ACP methyl ester carboxylesterase
LILVRRVPNPAEVVLLACAALSACRATDLSDLPELPPGRTLVLDGHAIFVRQTGTGPDVVMLHGLGDSSLGWQFLEGEIAEAGYRVTVWDALGAGRSAKPRDGDYSLSAHLRRLEFVFEELAIDEAAIVGHSLGGSLALAFACAHPERTSALCLIDPAAYREGALGGRWFWDTPLLAEIALGLLSTEMVVDFGLKQNFSATTRIPPHVRKLYIREARREGVIGALINQERQLIPRDADAWEAGHRGIRAPTFIVWGVDDALVPVAQGLRLLDDIAGAKLVMLPGLAHSPQLEDPAAVLAHLLPFLNEAMSP